MRPKLRLKVRRQGMFINKALRGITIYLSRPIPGRAMNASVEGHAKGRLNVYDGLLSAIRIAWITAILIDALLLEISSLVFSLDVAVLTLLVYEGHPQVTKGLDRPGDGRANFFEHDRYIKLLISLTAIGYALIIIPTTDVHVPHAIEPIIHALPGHGATIQSISLALAYSIGAALVIGVYLFHREPYEEGVLLRCNTLIMESFGTEFAENDRSWRRGFLSGPGSPYPWIVTVELLVGTAVSIITLLLGALFVALLSIPVVLVVIVAAWIGWDLIRHRLDIHAGLLEFTADLSEEIETPKRWFFEVELIDAGIKGIMFGGQLVLVLYLLVITFAAWIVPFLSEVLSTVPTAIEITIEFILSGAVPPGGLPLIGLKILYVIGIGSFSLAYFGYVFYVWYLFVQRFPGWIGAYPNVPNTVTAPRLPNFVIAKVIGLSIVYYGTVFVLYSSDLAAPSRTFSVVSMLLPILGTGATMLLFLDYHGVRPREMPGRILLGDHWRIPLFFLFVGIPPRLTYETGVAYILIAAAFVLGGYISDLLRTVEDKIPVEDAVAVTLFAILTVYVVFIAGAAINITGNVFPYAFAVPVVLIAFLGLLAWDVVTQRRRE